MTEKNGDLKYKTDNAIDEAYRRGFEDGFGKSQADAYRKGYDDGKKAELAELKTIKIKMPNDDGVGMIEQIKDLIRDCEKIDAYLLSYPAWRLINKLKKIVGWQLEDYEERQTEKSCENCKYYNGGYATFVCADGCKDKSNWKPQTEEIKVGDEVKVYDDCIGIVTRHAPQARTCYVMYRDGSCGEEELTDCKKTGNHSMSLDKWLEQMRKESHEV